MSDSTVKLRLSGDTDLGLVRQINEDSFRLLPDHNAVVVCDGMGGHAAGEVASSQSVETVATVLAQGGGGPPVDLHLPVEHPPPPGGIALALALRLANRRVFRAAQAQRKMQGMGTTAVAMIFEPGVATVCHVGDSRAYRYGGQQLEPITVDHSLVAELVARGEITEEQSRTFAERNIITRALGTHERVAVDISVFTPHAGDWYVLCSDGLCGYLEDAEIEQLLVGCGGDAEACVKTLLEAANGKGGEDNCTVAIVEVLQTGTATASVTASTETVPPETDDQLVAEDAWLDRVFPPGEDERQRQAAQEENTDRHAIGSLPPAPELDRDVVTPDEPPANKIDDTPADSVETAVGDEHIEDAPPATTPKAKGGGWPGRAGLVVLLAVIAVSIWLFVLPPMEHDPPPGNTSPQVQEARLNFAATDALHDAVIYIAGDSVGTAGEFLERQIPLRPDRFRIRAVWHDSVIFDSMVRFDPGNHVLTLNSVAAD